jgi:Nucleotidyl transferase AbiEii toxin, Type IV TA system
MFGTSLSFQEFAVAEPLPLAIIQEAVLEFLRDRDNVLVFGAQAVNAYVSEPRMTQDIDLMSLQAKEFVEELRTYLAKRFNIAVRVQVVGEGKGYKIYQLQKTENRHLVDVRPVQVLPATQRIAGVLVMAPAELIASKVVSYHSRRGKPKAGTDWRDIAMLFLKFPELKENSAVVTNILVRQNVDEATLALWRDLAQQSIQAEDDEDEFE